MNDVTNSAPASSDVVTRTTSAQGAKAERARAAKARSREVSPMKAVAWALLMGAGLAALAPVIEATSVRLSDQLLLQGDESATAATLAQELPANASADYYETLSELAMDARPADPGIARAAAERAVAIDPSRAQVWARIAWLDYLDTHTVTPEAVDALNRSIEACPLCDADLVRWRFNFVLANWASVPETLRHKVFEGADLLRWAGEPSDADFLAEMRTKATAAGIPYDQYRAAVATPVKSWDVQG